MTSRSYKLTVVLCAVSWFMVGLHVPVLHELEHADRPTPWRMLAILAAFTLLGLGDLWVLLRARGPASEAPKGGTTPG